MLNVHLRINDSTTGKPTPVRLRITTPDGTTYPPLGRFAEFPSGRNEAVGGHLKIGGERWCYIDGSCEVPLPAGVPLRVQAAKGPEYKPLDEMATLGPGQMSLRFAIARILNWRELNYYSADTRCHFLPPHAGLLEMMAEDLDIANGLAIPFTMLALDGNTYTTTPDLLAFSGQQPALTALPNYAFVVNTLNSHPVLGKVGLLHSHREVFPLTFGGPDQTDDWSICDWCDQCHRKGGLTVWIDAFEPAGNIMGGEALVAAILGKIDAIEIDPGPRLIPLLPWLYRLWNAGFTLPIAGASGKDGNKMILGAMRTYSFCPGEFNLPGWVESIRAGNTFVTSGPLVELQANGHRPGEEFNALGEVSVVASAAGLEPFGLLEIIANGQAIASAQGEFNQQLGAWSVRLRHNFTPDQSTWIAARCIGRKGFAHTSPIKLRLNNQRFPRNHASALALQQLVELTGEWAQRHGRYANAKRREQLLARCHESMEKLKS